MSNRKTLELERAKNALEAIKAVEAEPWKDKYASYVKSLPATILANGLGQAAATLLAAAKGKKSDDAHRALYDDLKEWLCRDEAIAPYHKKADLITAITAGDREAYLHAQAEGLAWLVWLKKFAAAYLPEGG